jgi:hypothetical protein
MLVRFLQQSCSPHGSFRAGDVDEIPDDVAKAWQQDGHVQILGVDREVQTATMPPAETAVAPPGKGKGRGKPKAG